MNCRRRRALVDFTLLGGLLAGSLGCSGGMESDAPQGMGLNDPAMPGANGGAGPIIGGGSGGEPPDTSLGDPGTKGVHRLNDEEYNATVQDLFEDPSLAPARGWLPGEAYGFDNIAEVLRINDGQFEKYFNAADTMATSIFARADQVAKIVICAQGPTCAVDIVNALGLRVWRRPLLAAEVTSMVAVYDRAIAAGLDHNNSVRELLRAFLSSPEFLYRIEFDADPASAVPHDVSQYDLASRLSYFLWSSTPDDALLAQAAAAQLHDPTVLANTVAAMLQSPKSNRLVANFSGQWLDVRAVPGHRAFPEVYPEWNANLGQSMATEAYSYFSEFLHSDLPWTEFLRADFNYVDANLAAHYGMTNPGAGVVRVVDTADQRMGFLGLGAFLTASSLPGRTSPTSRARRILADLLCSPPPDPPPEVQAEVDAILAEEETTPATDASQDIRAFLTSHSQPACAGCHSLFDPYGMALENFDGVGKWRTTYPSGMAVDATASINGTPLNGLPSVVEQLSADPRLTSCVTEKMFIYGLGRGKTATDVPYLTAITDSWRNSGQVTLRRLAQELALSAPFRTRHGGS